MRFDICFSEVEFFRWLPVAALIKPNGGYETFHQHLFLSPPNLFYLRELTLKLPGFDIKT